MCQQCGAWREHRRSKSSFVLPDPETHDSVFFTEFHKRHCHARIIHSNEAEFQSLPTEKQWQLKACPDFVPFEVACVHHACELQAKLIGTWQSTGSSVAEILTFSGMGQGRYVNWVGIDPDDLALTWEIREQFLVISPVQRGSGFIARLSPPNGVRFELLTYTPPYGKPKDLLVLYPKHESEPHLFELSKPDKSGSLADEWECHTTQPHIQTCRLTPDYIQTLLNSAARFRALSIGQRSSVVTKA